MDLSTLWLINGLGLGNSSRCLAVMQHLPGRHSVATFGNGLFFFQNRPEVQQLFEIEGMTYGASGSGGISLGGTLSGLIQLPQILRRNRATLERIVDRLRPQLILCDSYYGGIPSKANRRAAINNSDKIVGHFFRMRGKPLTIFPQFLLVEWLDWAWHGLLPFQRISPWFYPSLLCRREICESGPRDPSRILVMLSGSGLGPPVEPAAWGLDCSVDVIGRQGESQERVIFHGKLADNTSLLNQAGVLVVHAGFSAISEAMAMRKPFVAVPLPGHAEQWVNARFVDELGVGKMAASLAEVRPALEAILGRPEVYQRAYDRLPLKNDAAQNIARSLLSQF